MNSDYDLDQLWLDLQLAAGFTSIRPDFRFDTVYYTEIYEDISEGDLDPLVHFIEIGREEQRHPNRYDMARHNISDLRQKLQPMVTDQNLLDILESDDSEATEFVFELLALGAPIDVTISNFSETHYYKSYPDVKDAKAHALVHYLAHGMAEGRISMVELRGSTRRGAQEFDPTRPTCLICTHEYAKLGGAPVVSLRLAEAAAETHNVVVAGLRGGELEEDFLKSVHLVLVSNAPIELMQVDEPALRKIDFAILNSVECFPFMRWLIAEDVPYASYIHEYTQYTRPAAKAITVALFSDVLVFSTDTVRKDWAGIIKDIAFDLDRDSSILPQEQLVSGSVPADEITAARARLSELIGTEIGNRKLIFGAGMMQWRKGTDMFAMAAIGLKRRDPDAIILWIGEGRNHEDLYFGTWVEKHFQEAGCGKPDSNFFIMPSGPWYMDVLRAADVMFVPSRLDPLPNVVFDAVRHGVATVLFEGGTGFDDARYHDELLLQRVPFGDLETACDTLVNIPRKSGGDETPERARFGDLFDKIRNTLKTRLQQQRYFAVGGGDYDTPILYGDDLEAYALYRVKEREKLWTYGRHLVWRSQDAVKAELDASDNWIHKSIELAPFAQMASKDLPSFSVHIHAHYLDGLEDDLRTRLAFKQAERIVITTDTEEKAERILDLGKKVRIELTPRIMPNQGRDILPFIDLFNDLPDADDDDLWLHIHQKKSLAVSNTGDVWRNFLVTNLLGERNEQVSNAAFLAAQDGVGLVAPLDPFILGWTDSRRQFDLHDLALPGPLPIRPILFPVGNMFWTRVRVARRMRKIFSHNYPWPNEPIANDGTEFHFIERLWPAVAAAENLRSIFVDKPNERRV